MGKSLHSPELTLLNVRLIIENASEKIIESKVKGKPNCVECGKQINYTYSLCRECASIKRRTPNRPKIDVLINEVKEHGKTWCANKYNVSRTTIRRWLSK
jgi:hypothetical protein